MSTSTLGHYVRFGEAAIDSLDPVDSGMATRALGNLNHLADQYAQRRVGWVSYAGKYLTYDANQTVAASEVAHIWTSTAFDVHVRHDGESYRCRLRIRASSAHASAIAAFHAVLCPAGEAASEVLVADASNVTQISVASTGHAWHDAASLLYLTSDRVRRATRDVATIDSIGGATTTAKWLRAQLVIYAAYAGGANPRLSGVELDEYYAP